MKIFAIFLFEKMAASRIFIFYALLKRPRAMARLLFAYGNYFFDLDSF